MATRANAPLVYRFHSLTHSLTHSFAKVISPVACFGASHCAIHKNDLAKLDVEFRRLMRMVVGPPADTHWASPWHKILSEGPTNIGLSHVEAVWKFVSYVATLPSERCTRRSLEWDIRGPRKRGRPAYTSETALQRYCMWKGGGNWIVEAAAYDHWTRSKQDFVLVTLCTG